MTPFFHTLTILLITASLALLWLNWRERRQNEVLLTQGGDERNSASALRSNPDHEDSELALNLSAGPSAPVEPLRINSCADSGQASNAAVAIRQLSFAFLMNSLPLSGSAKPAAFDLDDHDRGESEQGRTVSRC